MIKILLLFVIVSCSSAKDWRTASRDSMGIAPKASEFHDDIVQVYYARAFSWRGYFGVHPWIAWKEQGAHKYTVAQVTSWNLRRTGKTSVQVYQDIPDRRWFGSDSHLLIDVRGKKAKEIIADLKRLIPKYPYADTYTLWPGPNSNTFVSYMIRNIDGLDRELPPHAIGKEYGDFGGLTASHTGLRFSLFGLLGGKIGASEGISIHILGLQFGFDLWTPAVELPFAGRLGFEDKGI